MTRSHTGTVDVMATSKYPNNRIGPASSWRFSTNEPSKTLPLLQLQTTRCMEAMRLRAHLDRKCQYTSTSMMLTLNGRKRTTTSNWIGRVSFPPHKRALEGQPKSGKLWEKHINKSLASPELGFASTTHDKTIYSATFRREKILLLRQVDELYDIIGGKLLLPNESKPPFTYLGLQEDFNGIDVEQTSNYV